MKTIKKVTENEMVALFLKTEINSNRWSQTILSLLNKDNQSRSIVDNPDVTDEKENKYRIKLLGDFRGYGRNEDLFGDFPDDVEWFRVFLTKKELEQVQYMKYSYWDELSNHTRLAKVGAETVESGKTIFDDSNDGFLKAAEAIKKGVKFPEMIFISKDEQSDIVVLEGHQRITAYFLVPEYIPSELEVIIGYSKNISQWDSY